MSSPVVHQRRGCSDAMSLDAESVSSGESISNDTSGRSTRTKNVRLIPILFSSGPAPNVTTIAYRCVVPSCGKHFSRRDNLVQHLKIHKDLDVSALVSTLPPSPPFSFQDFSDYERKSVSPVATSDDSSYSASPSPPHQHQTMITGMGLSEPQYLINDTFDRFLMTNITMAVSSLQDQDPASSTGVDYFYDASVGAMPQYVQQEQQSFNQHSAYSFSPPVSSLPQNQMPVHYLYQ